MRETEDKWGVPVSVQLATIARESSFRHDAQPTKRIGSGSSRARCRGPAPTATPRRSTAPGKATGRPPGGGGADRDDFADASDFIGWYMNAAARVNGVSVHDTYNQYLAYHEGKAGFARGTYRKKAWLPPVARDVEAWATLYEQQLQSCPVADRRPTVCVAAAPSVSRTETVRARSMDRLTEMEAFVQVVEHGGFTDAARKMGLSKSAVSKHVSALEARLAVRLLNRTTRRVSPTEVGLAYYDRARAVLSEARRPTAWSPPCRRRRGARCGSRRRSASGSRQVAPAVAQLPRRLPEVDVDMVLDDRFVELIAEGFDVAIRIGTLADSSLKARKLAEARGVVAASPATSPPPARRARSTTSPSIGCSTTPSSRAATSGGCAHPPARSARSASAGG